MKSSEYLEILEDNPDMLLLVADLMRFGAGNMYWKGGFTAETLAGDLEEAEIHQDGSWDSTISSLVREEDKETLLDHWSRLEVDGYAGLPLEFDTA